MHASRQPRNITESQGRPYSVCACKSYRMRWIRNPHVEMHILLRNFGCKTYTEDLSDLKTDKRI